MGNIQQQHAPKVDLKTRLKAHARQLCGNNLLQIYSSHESRDQALLWRFGPISVDMSFQRLNQETLTLLIRLAEEKHLDHAISQLFNKEHGIAFDSPQRHWLLRAPAKKSAIEQENLVAEQVTKMATLARPLLSGQWHGATGRSITDIIVLATGGPSSIARLTSQTFLSSPAPIKVHFISSLDGVELACLLQELSAESTLFVLSSRSFRTPDTLSNANMALAWLKNRLLGERHTGKTFYRYFC